MRLDLAGICKSFGENRVLRGVDLTVADGEIVALVGENGAGKSTLTRVISGVYQPDAGTISIDAAPVVLRGPTDAMARGIQVIYQEFRHNLFPNLTVAENVHVLDKEAAFGRLFVRKRAMAEQVSKLLGGLGIRVDPRTRVGDLSPAEQQMIEIAKAIAQRIDLIILDEPTAALDQDESDRLFVQLEQLRQAGVAIIYITHRMDDVFRLADRIVVLRDGIVALHGPAKDLNREQVVAAMAGQAIEEFYPKERHASDRPVLELRSLSCSDRFQDVSLVLRAGEILGIGGVLGCGRVPLLRSLFGLLDWDSGQVLLDGEPISPASPRHAIDLGIAYLTADRQAEGLCLQQSVQSNISLAALDEFVRAGVVRRRAEREATGAVMTRLKVRAASPQMEVGELSGGNQQKALFGKWVMTQPKVLLLEEPTRGVDVAAKVEIYRILNGLTAAGVAIILVSSDLPELVEMSDRVMVMRAGVIADEFTGTTLTQHGVLDSALAGAA
jgi:ABC-type sugar transport system ATPase subunit